MNWINELTDAWDKTADLPDRVSESLESTLPNGNHKVLILSMDLDENKPLMRSRLRFLDLNNREVTKVTFFGGDLSYVKRELKSIGIDVFSMDSLTNTMPGTVGKVVEVWARKSKKNPKYSDIYFSKDLNETMTVEPSGDETWWAETQIVS